VSIALEQALKQRKIAEDHVAEVLKRDYPVGKTIIFCTGAEGSNHYHGYVVMHCYGDRIKVRNCRTHKLRFIRASQIRTKLPDKKD
jgi:hypothetical protein